MDGIPVVIEEAKETMEPVCYNGGDYNPVPGGVKVESGGIATSMGAYYTDTNGDGYDESLLMTAAHLGSDCGGNPNGDTLYQNGDKYGTIVEFDEDLDTMLADSSSTSLSPEQTIQEPFSTISVYGSVTKSGTFDIEETGEIIYKMGIKTGRESGTLIDVQHQPGGCRDHNGEGIRADINVVQGDSGGPIYDVESGAAYMLSHASIAAAKSSNSECGGTVWEHTWGPAAYEIKNVHGGGFISGP